MNRRSFLRFLGVAPVAAAGVVALPSTSAARGVTPAHAIWNGKKRFATGGWIRLRGNYAPSRFFPLIFDNLNEKLNEHTARVAEATARMEARFAELKKQIARSYEDGRAITKHKGEEV